jgi:Na+/H+ antiporter NhaD/arsenite permease-like protein
MPHLKPDNTPAYLTFSPLLTEAEKAQRIATKERHCKSILKLLIASCICGLLLALRK